MAKQIGQAGESVREREMESERFKKVKVFFFRGFWGNSVDRSGFQRLFESS